MSSRTIVIMLQTSQEQGMTPAELFAGTQWSSESLGQGAAWLTWGDYCCIVENVHRHFDPATVQEMGRRGFEHPISKGLVTINRMLPSEATALRWMGRIATGRDSLFFRTLSWETREVGPSLVEIDIVVAEGHELPGGFADLWTGAFEWLPTLLGAPPAEVQHVPIPGGLRFQLAIAPRRGLFTWWRGMWSRLRPSTDADAARSAYELVMERNAELREQLEALHRSEAERRRLEEGLREAERLESIGRLAGGVAHDFNNLLTVILGRTDLLLAQADGELAEDLEEIRAATEGASRLTRQLLAFARKQVLQPEVLDVGQVVRDMEPVLRSALGSGNRLQADVSDGFYVSADRGQLEQVLLNLTVNARAAMPDGGVVFIELHATELPADDARLPKGATAGTWCVLSVRDTGVGIPEAMHDRVFEPFFTTRDQGTGLGLATVHGVVAQSGGFVDLQSVLGERTTFSVHLPRVTAAAPPLPPPSTSHGPARVLLVDDDDHVRRTLALVVGAMGYEVLVAGGGEEALAMLAEQLVDVVLSDVVMPGMSGVELAATIADRHGALPVILISGYAAGIADANIDPGRFLSKPVSRADLQAAFARVGVFGARQE